MIQGKIESILKKAIESISKEHKTSDVGIKLWGQNSLKMGFVVKQSNLIPIESFYSLIPAVEKFFFSAFGFNIDEKCSEYVSISMNRICDKYNKDINHCYFIIYIHNNELRAVFVHHNEIVCRMNVAEVINISKD